MKKVVIDANSCLIGNWAPFLSGIGRTTLELIRALEDRHDLPFELALYTQRVNPDRLQRYHFKSRQYNLPLPRKPWINWIRRMFPVVESLTGCDLYHIPHNCGDCFRKSHTVVTIHDALGFEMPELHWKSSIHKTVELAGKCRAIITCSHASKERLLRYLNVPESKIRVIHWGYDKNVFRVLPEEERIHFRKVYSLDRPFMLSVSCGVDRKRTPELIRQYQRLPKDYPYDLVIVWQNPPKEFADWTEESSGKRIRVLDGVTDQVLALLYNTCEFMVFPSVYEGFGLPVLEAMACGKPAVMVNRTSMPEVAGDAGIYFDSLEEDAIGAKLLEMTREDWKTPVFMKKCLERASLFSWEKCAKETLDLYMECL